MTRGPCPLREGPLTNTCANKMHYSNCPAVWISTANWINRPPIIIGTLLGMTKAPVGLTHWHTPNKCCQIDGVWGCVCACACACVCKGGPFVNSSSFLERRTDNWIGYPFVCVYLACWDQKTMEEAQWSSNTLNTKLSFPALQRCVQWCSRSLYQSNSLRRKHISGRVMGRSCRKALIRLCFVPMWTRENPSRCMIVSLSLSLSLSLALALDWQDNNMSSLDFPRIFAFVGFELKTTFEQMNQWETIDWNGPGVSQKT